MNLFFRTLLCYCFIILGSVNVYADICDLSGREIDSTLFSTARSATNLYNPCLMIGRMSIDNHDSTTTKESQKVPVARPSEAEKIITTQFSTFSKHNNRRQRLESFILAESRYTDNVKIKMDPIPIESTKHKSEKDFEELPEIKSIDISITESEKSNSEKYALKTDKAEYHTLESSEIETSEIGELENEIQTPEHEFDSSEIEEYETEILEFEDPEIEDHEIEASEIEDSESEEHETEPPEFEDPTIEGSETEEYETEKPEFEVPTIEDHEIEASEIEDSEIEEYETEPPEFEDPTIEGSEI